MPYGITQCYWPPNPAFTPAEAGTRFSDSGGMQGWVDLFYVKADRPGIESATCKSQVQRPTAQPPRVWVSFLRVDCLFGLHLDLLRAQRSVRSMGSLYLLFTTVGEVVWRSGNGVGRINEVKPHPHQQLCRSNKQQCGSNVPLYRCNIRLCC